MLDMYKGVVNSPETTITNDISNTDTLIYVLDDTRVPDDLPNLMTIGTGTNAETIKVISKTGSALTVERGFQGVAKAWNTGTIIARNFTEYDYEALKENIEELTDGKVDNDRVKTDVPANAKFTDTIYTHPTSAGNKHIPSGGAANQILRYASSGTAVWDDEKTTDLGAILFNNAAAHNSIYRGKNLGMVVTQKQWDDIGNGTFDDMYVGDYWTRNGTVYRIAHINYYRNSGDTNVPPNHLTLVPDVAFYNHVMNDTITTEGGWTGSKMYTEGLTQARDKINTDFAGHVVTLRKYLCNAVTNGEASAAAWTDVDIDLMNEIMVYGTITCGRSVAGTLNRNVGTEKSQLALFQHQPDLINKRSHNIWLKDIVSASYFALVTDDGFAYAEYASRARGVLPVFSIKK